MKDPSVSNELRRLLRDTIGLRFGENIEEQLPAIRAERHQLAAIVRHQLALSNQDVVVDFGSGCGFMAQAIAPHVQTVHCVDVRADFLAYCERETANYPNVRHHLVEYGTLSAALASERITAIYASAVFIHFNLYDVCVHLQEFASLLRPGGRVWFDFRDGTTLHMAEPTFTRHLALYRANRAWLPQLLNFVSRPMIENVARQLGFQSLDATDNIMVLTLE